MTVHEALTEYDHLEARDAWEDAELRLRTVNALALLDALDAVAPRLHPSDLFDAAHGIWAVFMDGRAWGDRLDPLMEDERADMAYVFARTMKYLTSQEVIAAAGSAWGDVEFSETREGHAVTWVPSDRVVYLTLPGRVFATVLVITDERAAGLPDHIFAERDRSGESVLDAVNRIETGVEGDDRADDGSEDVAKFLVSPSDVVGVATLEPRVGDVESVSEVVSDLAHDVQRTGDAA